MLLTLAMIIVGSLFIVVLLLLCAEEGHEIEGVGFHRGPAEGCPLCRAYDNLPQPCRSCGIGPCVCGEFDIPPSPLDGHLERASAEPGVRSLCDSIPPHASEVAHD